MSKYIDAENISKQIADFKKSITSPNSDYMTGYICALSVTEGMIANAMLASTADVVEVRHGEWEEIKCGYEIFDYYFKCSNCGNTTPPKAFPIAPDYCPNCGAKMDGERKTENEG
jgi:hypothetical protein